ncbi:MAG: DUF882 domain-containing protein [Proteobacteria bacterium]|nr:DUF882 domain-containing protein [Pseudomonadota bacterium]
MSRALAAAVSLTLIASLIASTADADPGAKKDRDRAGKTTDHAAPPKLGQKPARLVNLYNTWTDEWLAVDPKAPPRGAQVDRFLRDHYTNAPLAGIEPRLVDIVVSAAVHFQRDTVMVVSAFRHPKYNLLLRKKGHQVARDSHHSKGDAIDFFLPRVSTNQLHKWAIDQKIGGVGIYLDSGFVHMDTGPVRRWSGE